MHNANFRFDRSFDVGDVVSLREDLTRIGPRTPVVIDLREVLYVTESAIDALAAALSSLTGRRIFGVGFEGVGIEKFRALGVVC